MKLVKVTHERCDEYSGTSYVWVPDYVTESDVHEAQARAMKEYTSDAAVWALNKDGPLDPGFSPRYDSFPKMTVEEIKAAHKVAKAKHDEWQATRRKAQRNFTGYLIDQIPGAVYLDDHADITTNAYWGHRHGQRIDQGDFNSITADMRGAAHDPDEEDGW